MKNVMTPWQIEWNHIVWKEERYLKKNAVKKESFLNLKLEDKVPQKLQGTLDKAFGKAFELVFEKGTGVIEKTYKKTEFEHDYKVNELSADLREDKKSLRAFSKKAMASGAKNLLLSGVEGVGLGVLGIGIPDIPLFVGMLLKSIYEVALHYGYSYDSEEEKFFILKMIQISCLHGEELYAANKELDRYLESGMLPDSYEQKAQIRETAGVMSTELLYMKFLQGIPIVGAVGGVYDSIYMQKVLSYVKIKYNKRFLRDRRKQ